MPSFINGISYPILSRYDIPLDKRSVIGRGGMGVVFKAHDRLINREVAIKTIHPSLVDIDGINKDFHKRLFFREAMAHARLGIEFSRNIIPVRNYGIEDDTPFMEMEILHGKSLRQRMNDLRERKKKGRLFDIQEIQEIITQICAGLEILHEYKVFHSDLKPENIIFVNKDSLDLKIADLGIAHIAESGLLTQAGINTFLGGSMHYTPQSVAERMQKSNERTDIYSIGVILYEMITRNILYWGQAKLKFIEEHPELPIVAKDIIKRSCQLMGRNNYKSIKDIANRIKDLNN